MAIKRIVCFVGFLWETVRTVVIFRLGAVLVSSNKSQTTLILLWCAIPQIVMPVGFFFLGYRPERYGNYSRLLAVGKTAGLAGAVMAAAAGDRSSTLTTSLLIGFLLVALLDLLFLVFLLFYPRLETGKIDRGDSINLS